MNNLEVIRMEANYRCAKSICEAAQNLIEHNPDRVAKTMWSARNRFGEVQVLPFLTEASERQAIGGWVEGMMQCKLTAAVLLRYNDHVNLWVDYLEGRGIKVARTKAVQRPRDWALAKTCLALLCDPESDWLAYQVLKLTTTVENANSRRAAATMAGCSINSLAFQIPLEIKIQHFPKWLVRMGISRESYDMIHQVVIALGDDVTGEDILLELNRQEETTEGEGCYVGTIHSAKGREWNFVALPMSVDQIMPGHGAKVDCQELRRLLYVGMTRAKDALVVSYSGELTPSYGDRTPQPATPSRFIAEMACHELPA